MPFSKPVFSGLVESNRAEFLKQLMKGQTKINGSSAATTIVVLKKANDLVTYIHVNADSHALKKTRVLCLKEIPELLIQFFEVITEPIPAELKPFRSIQEKSETLQNIIDTLEQHLKLPLSHVNGRDVAKLDRRQLSDVLQIFEDLIQQVIKPKPEVAINRKSGLERRTGNSPDVAVSSDRPLSLDQLQVSSPIRNTKITKSSTRYRSDATETSQDGASRQPSKSTSSRPAISRQPSTLSPVTVAARHREPHREKSTDLPEPIDSSASRRSLAISVSNTASTTCHDPTNAVTKESFPHKIMSASVKRKSSAPYIARGEIFSVSKEFFPREYLATSVRRKPSATYTLPDAKSTASKSIPRKPLAAVLRCKPSMTSSITSSVTSRDKVRPQLPAATRNQSSVSSQVKARFQISPTALRTTKTTSSFGRPECNRDVPRKPLVVPIRRLSTISAVTPLEKSKRLPATRRPSTKSFKTRPTIARQCSRSSDKSDPFVSDRIGNHQDMPNNMAITGIETRSSGNSNQSPTVAPRRRKPSVVSSKVRKHSFASPSYHDLKHGIFSPRTVSLASSIKLLQEFDYVRKRLSEIELERAKHLEALCRLDDEKIRLVYVMDHIKEISNRPIQQAGGCV